MTSWVALLRAVNLGPHNKVPMAELKELCEGLGFAGARSYIASGNVFFASDRAEASIREAIEAAIAAQFGKRIEVLVRSAAELAEVVAGNPWPERPGNRVAALFCDAPLSLAGMAGQRGEVVAIGPRAFYIDHGEGMADSRLRIPAAKLGTARNMNTVAKLAELADSN